MAVAETICECGKVVKGMTKEILKVNLKTHKRGNKHKELMKIKERWKAEERK
ncbi:hypothetical protein ES703_36720 [subsurface metagenome]